MSNLAQNNPGYTSLINDCQRPDGYVNATKWAKHFNYRLNNWKELPETKARVKELSKRNGLKISQLIIVEGKGRGATTWLHPIMAIHFAQYLSPDFANFVAEIFKRYIEADPALADEIIQKQDNPEQLEWIKQRLDGKLARIKFTDVLKDHGVTAIWQGRRKVSGYAICTGTLNKLVLGKTASEIKKERGVKETRDGLDEVELSAMNLAEVLARKNIQEKDAQGTKACNAECQQAGKRVAKIFEEE